MQETKKLQKTLKTILQMIAVVILCFMCQQVSLMKKIKITQNSLMLMVPSYNIY